MRTIYIKAELASIKQLLEKGLIDIECYRRNLCRLLRELELCGN